MSTRRKNMLARYTYKTLIGNIVITEENEKIIGIEFEESSLKIEEEIQIKQTALIKRTYQQIKEYLEGNRKQFDIPINLKGTTFRLKVWNALLTIPYGETKSYQEIAKQVKSPKACRAVGMANHNNPISIIVPCHRVIGKSGKLVGYGGGLEIKEKLLEIEKKYSTNSKIFI